MNLSEYGYKNQETFEAGIPARITSHNRGHYECICEHGVAMAQLKPGAYRNEQESLPCVGDFVLLDWRADGTHRILKTLPRKTYFSRLDPSSSGHKEQAVAANFDYAFLVQSLGNDFNERRLERYLTLAWQSGATPVVVLTKADTLEDYGAQLRAAQETAIGAQVYAVSAQEGIGMQALQEYFAPGKTIVLLGSSGVGKSSLINALAGETVMATGAVRESDGRGKHTTTQRQLVRLPNGALVIDTPGMRELGMWDVSEGLGKSFSDVEAYFGQCKFSDCRHESEPGCAIKRAIAEGELPLEHWESYLKLAAEARYVDDKTAYLRAVKQRHKQISKQIRQHQTANAAPDYRREACGESFTCKHCGAQNVPEGAGSEHRNHCSKCLTSLHVDKKPGDRASQCKSVMDPIGVWVRKNGEWAIIHRCRGCGELSSNRIAADDNSALLLSIAAKPLAQPPFPLWKLEQE